MVACFVWGFFCLLYCSTDINTISQSQKQTWFYLSKTIWSSEVFHFSLGFGISFQSLSGETGFFFFLTGIGRWRNLQKVEIILLK